MNEAAEALVATLIAVVGVPILLGTLVLLFKWVFYLVDVLAP